MAKKAKYPFGPATDSDVLSATGAQALTIQDNLTIVDGVTTQATGARTFNLTVDDSVDVGALLWIKSKSAATENNTFGTGMTGPTVAGVAGKILSFLFIYDGTAFVQAGAHVQID